MGVTVIYIAWSASSLSWLTWGMSPSNCASLLWCHALAAVSVELWYWLKTAHIGFRPNSMFQYLHISYLPHQSHGKYQWLLGTWIWPDLGWKTPGLTTVIRTKLWDLEVLWKDIQYHVKHVIVLSIYCSVYYIHINMYTKAKKKCYFVKGYKYFLILYTAIH